MTLSTAPSMPLGGLVFHGAAAAQGTLWLGGGTDNDGISNVIQVLDWSAGVATWRDGAQRLSANRTRLAAAAVSPESCAEITSAVMWSVRGGVSRMAHI